MKKIVTKTGVFIAACFALLVMSVPAQAQEYWMRVDVPFAFFAGEQRMPAGVYRVKYDGAIHSVDMMSIADSSASRVRVQPGGVDRSWNSAENGTLTFNKYGSDYVLKRVFFPGVIASHDLRGSKIEAELARNAAPTRETIVSRLRK